MGIDGEIDRADNVELHAGTEPRGLLRIEHLGLDAQFVGQPREPVDLVVEPGFRLAEIEQTVLPKLGAVTGQVVQFFV